MKIRATLLSALLATAVTVPAVAQDWPDLVGTWKGTTRAVVANAGGHYADAGSDDAGTFATAELTIEWTEADNGRYIGTISSPQYTERVLAVVSSDGQSIFTVDSDGLTIGRLMDEDRFELCYLQSSSADTQMAASCVEFERQ